VLNEGRAPTMGNIRTEVRNVTFMKRSEPSKPNKPLVLEGQRFTEEVQQTALWWAVRHGILNEVNTQTKPVEAAAAVPADKKLWARDQVARQITWLSQFTDALIEDVQKSVPEEDCARVEENARSR
jgi:hypothetical protein